MAEGVIGTPSSSSSITSSPLADCNKSGSTTGVYSSSVPPKRPSFVDNNFVRCTVKDGGNPGVCYLRHPTGVLVITLAADHPCMEEGKRTVTQVDYVMNRKRGRGQTAVTGKGKKGALSLNSDTRICIVRCSDGSEYPIRAGIRGSLIEVNDALVTRCNLVHLSRENRGYLAIVLPNKGDDTKLTIE